MRKLAATLAGLLLLAGALAALDRAFPPDLTRLQAPGGAVLDDAGRLLALRATAQGQWRFQANPDEIAPIVPRLLVDVEDRRFYAMPGVDPLAVLRAAWQMVRAGRVVSGGSTLTMQVAKLLHPAPRTLGAKLTETLRALQLAERYDKRRILGMWLSLAPFGGNLEGIEAASWAYFGKPAGRLDAAEAALLIGLPRRPEALRPDRHPARALALRNRILHLAFRDGLLSAAELRVALAEPGPTSRRPMPDDVPLLFARRGGTLATTLDRPVQRALAALGRDALRHLPPHVSLAVMIADLKSRNVIAAFAGDVGNPQRAGAVDLTRAVRSPGSALKPFLYGLAFEDGLAGPDTLLQDSPTRFRSYAPEDFSRQFSGRVSAADALRQSLNLPAVILLSRYGPQRFVAQLMPAGLRLPKRAAASLPVILGGAGISLRHLLALYTALGSDGRVASLRLLRMPGARDTGSALLSPAAASEVAAILTRPFPEGGPDGIAWKTGTSAGNRDSWALGFDRTHAIAVWIGRPDGTARPGKAAADTALPVLARLFGLLPAAPRITIAAQAPTSLTRGPDPHPLQIASPPPATVLEGPHPIMLRAMGGDRPLRFLVNGAPITSTPALRETQWTPPGPGFFRVSVLDATGRSASVSLRVVPAEQPDAAPTP